MSLHFVLFSLYAWVLWATLRQLEAPARAINTAGLFLLAITFHDRPDSLAHLFGILAIYSCYARGEFRGGARSGTLV